MGNAIKEINGNLFDSHCFTYINPVNCIGDMGAGIAIGFKMRFPKYYEDYRGECLRKGIDIGMLYLYDNGMSDKFSPGQICSFPVKKHWKENSKIEWIEKGLLLIMEYADTLKSIAIPAVGCGCGGLNWDKIRVLIHDILSNYPMRVELYMPWGKR